MPVYTFVHNYGSEYVDKISQCKITRNMNSETISNLVFMKETAVQDYHTGTMKAMRESTA